MSLDEINEFLFDEVEYVDSERGEASYSMFTPNREKKRIDHVKTGIVVWHPPGTHISRYKWQHREVWFHTGNPTQILDIEIHSPQSMSDDRPRFHIHRVDSNEPQWIRYVEHRLRDNQGWTGLDDITASVPAHTRFVRLHLILPATGPAAKFKLILYARDRDFQNKEINCDPVIGNDPP